MPASSELVNRLIVEANLRFARFHSKPEVASLSEAEVSTLCEKYDTSVLLEAMRRTGHCVKKETTMTHANVLRAVYNLAERVSRSKPMVRPTPIAAPVPVPTNRERLMALWQSDVATSHDFIPLDEWADNLLKMYDYSTVQDAISSLGHTYEDYEAQEALDAVAWKCEQFALVNQ